jgi:hypothetical protein
MNYVIHLPEDALPNILNKHFSCSRRDTNQAELMAFRTSWFGYRSATYLHHAIGARSQPSHDPVKESSLAEA